MSNSENREQATQPEDLSRFFLERANAGDVDGLVALYEPDAVLVGPDGRAITGSQALREGFNRLLSGGPKFEGETQAAVRNGDLALTSTRFTTSTVGPDGKMIAMKTATVEVARRQPNGTWLWLIDRPNILA